MEASKPRVLLVDDNPTELLGLIKILATSYEVSVESNPRSVLERLPNFDAVVLDDNLGDIKYTGYELLKDILREFPNFPTFAYLRVPESHEGPLSKQSLYHEAGCLGVWLKGRDDHSVSMRLGLALGHGATLREIENVIEQRTPQELVEIKNGRQKSSVGILWGDGYGCSRARINLASSLSGQADVELRANKKEGASTLKKAMIVSGECLQPIFTFLQAHKQGLFLEAALASAGEGLLPFFNRSFREFASPEAISVIEFYATEKPDEGLSHCKKHTLLCSFSKGLKFVDYFANLHSDSPDGGSAFRFMFLGRVNRPKLALPVRELASIASREYSVLDDLVKRGKDCRIIKHRGILVESDRGVFGPAIDTLWFNEFLHKHVYAGNLAPSPECICELGCGSGLLLCSLLQQYSKSAKKVIAVDVSDSALELTNRNLNRLIDGLENKPQVFLIRAESALDVLAKESIDILVTNPPYLPSKDTQRKPDPLHGTKVLRAALESGKQVVKRGGLVVVLRSSLTQDQDLWEKVSKDWDLIDAEESPFSVPLDLLELAGDPQWEHVNLDAVKAGLVKQLSHPLYSHWHNLELRALRRKRS